MLSDPRCALLHNRGMDNGLGQHPPDQADRALPVLQGGTQADVRDWLNELVRVTGWSASELAKQAGLAASTVNRFLNKPVKHNLSTTTINKLRLAAGRRAQEVAGRTAFTRPTDARLPAPPLAQSDYVMIRVFDVEAAAGHGTRVDDEHVTGHLAFRPDWLRRVSDAPPEQLGVISVRGDSMENTLKHDDTVLVDFTQVYPRRDGIFVIRYDDAVQVKRVTIHPVTRRLTVKSDNPEYQTFHDLDPADLDIVGRVIWLGRQV